MPTVASAVPPEGATVPGVLADAVARDPDHVFLHCGGRTRTTGQLDAGSAAVAARLIEWGIEPGDRVAVMMPNVPEFLDVWFGILRARAIEVPVHAAYRGELLAHILVESGARILFTDVEFEERLAAIRVPTLERIVLSSELAGFAAPEAVTLPAPDPRDVTCLLYTSGTTGPSKGVVLSHGANLTLTRANVALMEYTSADTLYTAFPLFHVNAKFTSVVSALLTGARLVLDDRFSASRFWDRIREEEVTSFNSMGTMLTVIAKQPPSPRDRDHRVQRAYVAAATPELWEVFQERFGVRLHEHYGMTETGITLQNTRLDRRRGSIGRPVPHYEVRVADEFDRALAAGEVGEIQVRPRHPDIMIREYWQRPEVTVEATRNLWFHTGDRARVDADGYFYYVDRLKDSIRRRGENVSSFEVESAVNRFAGVVESAAFGVPSELGEDDVMIAIVPAGPDVHPAALIEHCRAELAYFAVPRYVRVVASLPKNASERVQKHLLRAEGITADTWDGGPIRRPTAATDGR